MLRRFVLVLLMLGLVPVSIAAAAITGDDPVEGPPATTEAAPAEPVPPAISEELERRPAVSARTFVLQIERFKRETWRWQRLMSVRRSGTANRNLAVAGYETLVAVRNKWRSFAARARRRAQNPPHQSAWLCIHRYEGAWTDSGAPFYGGLQMDWSFMSSYGGELLRRKGHAGNWTPLEQMWVAERAYRSGRGFYPWPSTARHCGLL